jgi:hypothetical protein
LQVRVFDGARHHQIDRPSKQRFKFFLEIEIVREGTRLRLERDQEVCIAPARIKVIAAARVRTRSRIASWSASGTHTAVSSPARNSLACVVASRRSVLTRSPGRRGISDGATTMQAYPRPCR